MEPLAGTIIVIACDHLAIADPITIAVSRLILIFLALVVSILIALQTAVIAGSPRGVASTRVCYPLQLGGLGGLRGGAGAFLMGALDGGGVGGV